MDGMLALFSHFRCLSPVLLQVDGTLCFVLCADSPNARVVFSSASTRTHSATFRGTLARSAALSATRSTDFGTEYVRGFYVQFSSSIQMFRGKR